MGTEIIPYVKPEPTRDEIIDHILGEMVGGRSLNSVLTLDEGMPSWGTFWRWYSKDEELAEKLARARETGIEALMEKAQHIAETPVDGLETTLERGPDGIKMKETRKDMLGHRRLVIDTYIKRAQMMKPKTYGPRLDLTSDGEKLSSIADAVAAGNKRIEERTKQS